MENTHYSNRLVKLADLSDLCGYKDMRSIAQWCAENKIPVLTIGKMKYTIENFLEIFIEKEIKSFMQNNYHNGKQLHQLLKSNMIEEIIKEMDVPKRESGKRKVKRFNSKASNEFMRSIKIA
jgi:hypothetical protein